MPYKSVSDFEEHYDGSVGVDGETRSSSSLGN
jgi:hypothetical protein